MRVVVVALVSFFATAGLTAQTPKAKTSADSVCEDQSKSLPDYYYEAVLSRIKPPGSQDWLISITLTGERKIVLGTNGDKFQLWTDTPDFETKTIGQFLRDLAAACRLPYNPADAAALVKIKWESRELTLSQFSQIHHDLTQAALGNVSKAQGSYATLLHTKILTMHLDSPFVEISYDNGNEHFELRAWDEGEKSTDPVVKWSHHVQGLAEESFHRPFERKSVN